MISSRCRLSMNLTPALRALYSTEREMTKPPLMQLGAPTSSARAPGRAISRRGERGAAFYGIKGHHGRGPPPGAPKGGGGENLFFFPPPGGRRRRSYGPPPRCPSCCRAS